MTKAMRVLLTLAAQCEPGKGVVVYPDMRRMVGSAVGKGYGTSMSAGSLVTVFIINETGRAALGSAA